MTTFRNIEFSCSIPELTIDSVAGKARVVVAIDGTAIYDEWLYPMDGALKLHDLSQLVTPYARQKQTVALEVTATAEDGTELVAAAAQVVYCQADFGEDTPENFLQNHFLSILMGTKITALGRRELLHMQGSGQAACTAQYDDGTTQTFAVEVLQYGAHYMTFDVSPDNFTAEGKALVAYAVTAGNRRQDYEIDMMKPDCAPMLVFVNSFGLDEMAYCTGLHKVAPNYKRSMAYIGRVRRNYKIDETREFKADTGPLNAPMANWWDEVFRSDSVRIVNFLNGNINVGKELIITDSKSEYSNDDAEIPRFTFSYCYAQRNHNVVQLLRAGRIFDNTFDNTFN